MIRRVIRALPYLLASLVLIACGQIALSAREETIVIENTDPRLEWVFWSADAKSIVTRSDERLEAWDVATREKIEETTEPLLVDLPLAYSNISQPIAWTSDGQYAAVASEDGSEIMIYERGNVEPVNRIRGAEGAFISGIVWKPGTTVLTPQYDGFVEAVSFYNALDGTSAGEIAIPAERTFAASLTFSPDGRFAFTSFSMGVSTIRIFDGALLDELTVETEDIAYTVPVAIRWLSPETLYLETTNEGVPAIYDVAEGTLTALPQGFFAWSPDGTRGVTFDDEQNLSIVDAENGEVVDTLPLTEYNPEVVRLTWGIGGIVVYRSLPLTIFPME